MDKAARQKLEEGARALGLALPEGAFGTLELWADELLKWNAKVNLTAIIDPGEVVEKHLLDSLAVLPDVAGATSLLDLGAGAGLPGLPLAIALPSLTSVTLVDAVNKKVAFVKHIGARLGLSPRVRAVHLRAEGQPDREGIARAEVVIARALMEVSAWVPFALPYLADGGRLVAMLARPPPKEELEALAGKHGLRLTSLRTWALPFSGDPRSVAVFGR